MFPPTAGVRAPVPCASCTYGRVVSECYSEHLRLCLWHWTCVFFQRECIQLNIEAGQRPERWAIGKVILGYIGLVLNIGSELSIVLGHTDNSALLLNCLCFLKH
jgi:hypothetical protein